MDAHGMPQEDRLALVIKTLTDALIERGGQPEDLGIILDHPSLCRKLAQQIFTEASLRQLRLSKKSGWELIEEFDRDYFGVAVGSPVSRGQHRSGFARGRGPGA